MNRASWVGGSSHFDALIIGSGVGGSMVAYGLVEAGLRVLMLERGPRVQRGPENWAPDAVMELSPYYTMDGNYRVRGDDRSRVGTFQCVGGTAVFYGGVSYRLRVSDFEESPDVSGASGAHWPYGYADLEPYYGVAERLLGVAGREGQDPTDPPRTDPYPQRAPDVQGPAKRIWDAAVSLGLHPAHLPLAIDFGIAAGTSPCARCGTCDGYACAIQAKRDPGSALLPGLERRGLTVLPNAIVVRLLRRGGRVEGAELVDRDSGRVLRFTADRYVLAAGALGSPHLILASGLHTSSPARGWVGRGLMRHCNGLVYGLFPDGLEGARAFHKQVGIMDLYGGEDGAPPTGTIQSIHAPPPGLLKARAPLFADRVADPLVDHCTGLLSIAEDQPQQQNRIEVSRSRSDRYGVPRATVTHRYTERDLRSRRILTRAARAILTRAGSRFNASVRIKTFSHAVGTLRMGRDPRSSPLDATSRFRGVENLWVTDASFMPRSGAVNPSLTIAANALRAAEHIAGVAVFARVSISSP